MDNLHIIDCTLRDGGYYNNWCFDHVLVENYLSSIHKAGIKYVELGFRSLPKKGFHGPFAYTTDSYIDALEIPNALNIGVMVNASSILQSKNPCEKSIRKIFCDAKLSKIKFVRVAAHFHDLKNCKNILQEIKLLGYATAINIMQISGKEGQEITKIAKIIEEWGVVDTLYFADSMGSMDEEEIYSVITSIKKSWSGDIGLHAHNNLGKANGNSLYAIKEGINWVDVTINGMGRGAGNAQTEIILNELNRNKIDKYTPACLYEMILEYFEPLARKYGWGPNFIYYYSARNNIHPSYAQELLSDKRYSPNDVVNALGFLAKNDSTKFKTNKVNELLSTPNIKNPNGKWNATNWCKNEDVLLLGAGQSLKTYSKEIEKFICRTNIKTLSINYHDEIDDEIITSYVAADIGRLTLDIKRYKNTKKPIILPESLLTKELYNELKFIKHYDYGIAINPDNININSNGCELPSMLSAMYAIALSVIGGARRIYLVGFDGYSSDDNRHIAMSESLELLRSKFNKLKIIALTPTTYPIEQSSIYAPYV